MKNILRSFCCLLLGCVATTHPPNVADIDDISRKQWLPAVQTEVETLKTRHNARRVDIVVVDVNSSETILHEHFGADTKVSIASTFKPIAIAAAIDTGIDPRQRFDGESGKWEVDGGTLSDAHPLKTFDASLAILHSSNIGTAKLVAAAGTVKVGEFAKTLGLGNQYSVESWQKEGGLIRSVGIGFIADPVSLAQAYAKIVGANSPLSEQHKGMLLEYLQDAVGPDGTGHQAFLPDVSVAGKTGTSSLENGNGAWFVGITPPESPSKVVVVYAEVPKGYGGNVAAPSFARIISAQQ